MVNISFASNISGSYGGNGDKPFPRLISFNFSKTKFNDVVGAGFDTLTPPPHTK